MAQEQVAQYNQTQPLVFLLVSASDHITGVTGASPTVTLSKSGGAFTPPGGAVSEIGDGWYKLAPNPGDANTLGPLVLHATATGADPVDTQYTVVNYSPTVFVPGVPTVSPTGVASLVPTFETVWRKIRLFVPGAPVFLVRNWVQNAYRTLTDKRQWGWSIFQGQLTFQASRALTSVATVTQGSTMVTAPIGTFVASDGGRQFTVGSYPIYTVFSVAADGSSILLDQPFYGNGSGVAASAQIYDAYGTLPANFSAFQIVLDPVNQRIVPWWLTQEEFGLLDPVRMAAESVPRLLAASKLSTYPPTLGQVQYEYWPKPTAQGALQYYASGRPLPLRDTDPILGVLRDRTDILEAGALAWAARWPGTTDKKNPYFNPQLAMVHEAQFQTLANQLDLRDDDQFQQSFNTIPWQRWSAWTWAYDTRLLRETDASLGSYFGGGLGSSAW